MIEYYHRKRQTKSGLRLYPKKPVRAHEKRYWTGSSIVPTAQKMKMTQTARALIDARAGNENALNYLVGYVASLINNHAISEKWGIELTHKRSLKLAYIALYPFIFNDSLSLQKSADMVGVTKSPFVKNWSPKVTRIRCWVRVWDSETV